MKTATKNLEDDHVYVLKLTGVMKIITQSVNPDIEHIESIVDINRNFADGLHHAKEENIFFPALGKKGFSAQQGPVAVMLNEHIQGRNFVKGITDNLEMYKKGDAAALKGIFQNMNGYADLLISHIAKENNILFRMADNVLTGEEQAGLLKEFNKVEINRPEGTRVNDYIERINSFAKHYKL
jgi:hemerythrin-like domain-containing protein